jgi:hypothetical protein
MAQVMVLPALTQNPDGYRDSPGFRQSRRNKTGSYEQPADSPSRSLSAALTSKYKIRAPRSFILPCTPHQGGAKRLRFRIAVSRASKLASSRAAE